MKNVMTKVCCGLVCISCCMSDVCGMNLTQKQLERLNAVGSFNGGSLLCMQAKALDNRFGPRRRLPQGPRTDQRQVELFKSEESRKANAQLKVKVLVGKIHDYLADMRKIINFGLDNAVREDDKDLIASMNSLLTPVKESDEVLKNISATMSKKEDVFASDHGLTPQEGKISLEMLKFVLKDVGIVVNNWHSSFSNAIHGVKVDDYFRFLPLKDRLYHEGIWEKNRKAIIGDALYEDRKEKFVKMFKFVLNDVGIVVDKWEDDSLLSTVDSARIGDCSKFISFFSKQCLNICSKIEEDLEKIVDAEQEFQLGISNDLYTIWEKTGSITSRLSARESSNEPKRLSLAEKLSTLRRQREGELSNELDKSSQETMVSTSDVSRIKQPDLPTVPEDITPEMQKEAVSKVGNLLSEVYEYLSIMRGLINFGLNNTREDDYEDATLRGLLGDMRLSIEKSDKALSNIVVISDRKTNHDFSSVQGIETFLKMSDLTLNDIGVVVEKKDGSISDAADSVRIDNPVKFIAFLIKNCSNTREHLDKIIGAIPYLPSDVSVKEDIYLIKREISSSQANLSTAYRIMKR